jgi:hypothetical protein
MLPTWLEFRPRDSKTLPDRPDPPARQQDPARPALTRPRDSKTPARPALTPEKIAAIPALAARIG